MYHFLTDDADSELEYTPTYDKERFQKFVSKADALEQTTPTKQKGMSNELEDDLEYSQVSV